MPKTQTRSSKLVAAVLFVCILATWRQNIQILEEVTYLVTLLHSSSAFKKVSW